MIKPCARCKIGVRCYSSAYCRPCGTQVMKEWRKKHPTRNQATQKKSDKKRWTADRAKFTKKRLARHHRWRDAHPEEAKAQMRQKYANMRDSALARLGTCCACCGETHKTMLEIDHIHNDGAIERKAASGNARGHRSFIYTNIRGMLDPNERYQILCSSCNKSKARNKGVCEHKTEDRSQEVGFCA